MTSPLRLHVVPDQPQGDSAGPLAVDARGLAALLSCGLRTVRRWNAAGQLPAPVHVGGRLLWIVSEVRGWLAAGAPDRVTWEARKRAGK